VKVKSKVSSVLYVRPHISSLMFWLEVFLPTKSSGGEYL
jgi:hypothetical protein